MEFIMETPINIDELVRKAGDLNEWENRLSAVHELGKYDCQQSRDVLVRLALHDKVFGVKEAAFRYAQGLGIYINGKPLTLGKKSISYSTKEVNKAFARAKKEAHLDDFNLEVFKEKLKSIQPEMYNVMEYEKKVKFDEWITNIYKSLPKN